MYLLLSKELIINATTSGVTIALLQDRQLLELHQEKSNNNYVVGDIYFGRIKKIMPGLNAAFVDVGYEKDAFLHYLDLGAQIKSLIKYAKLAKAGSMPGKLLAGFELESDILKSGKISEVLLRNQLIPVQIAKEPISSKGPRLSSEISLAGRFVILVPFSNTVSISKKIKSNGERSRLKKLIDSIKPENFGVIIRTVSEGRGVEELQKDVKDLCEKWENITNGIKITEPGKKIIGEIDRSSTILRDLLNASFNNVVVNDPAVFEETRQYIKSISPEQEKIVKLHKGKESIFEYYGIDRQIKGLFGKTVTLPGGAYLVIEHTEALHVIDVNSGNRTSNDINQEESALMVNMEAAKEIGRQLRLRDMGGIIVVDFIDMHKPNNRKTLFDSLRQIMLEDRAKHTILPPSKFGLVQITRQRVRPEMNIVTVEKCPACDGTGEIKASIILVDDIQNNLNYILTEQNEKTVILTVHPYIEAFLKKGLISLQMKWFMKYKKWIKITGVPNHHLTEFHFLTDKEEEIKL